MAAKFTLEYWKTEKWFVGRLKEVPGVFSQGKTLKELKINIKDAYDLMMEDQKEFSPDVETSEIEIVV